MARRILSSTAAIAAFILGSAGNAVPQERHADAHVHGVARLQLVTDGPRVSLAFNAPAADLLGFEHTAETDEQKGAVEIARRALGDPIALFGLPGSLGCAPSRSDVHFTADEPDDHDHDQDHDHGEGHAEFVAEYELTCSTPVALPLTLETSFFDVFPLAGTLSIEALVAGRALRLEIDRQSAGPVLQ